MKTLHEGKNLHLKEDGDALILDVKWGGHFTRDQIAMVEARGMVEAENDTWYGDAAHKAEILKLVTTIDQPWASREAERLAMQQMRGGR